MALLAVAMLAGTLVTIATPQRAEAAVEDYVPATYNMQGGSGSGGSKWTTDIMQLINSGYNVIALQEAGPRPPASAGEPKWTSDYLGGTQHWAGWRVQRYEWDPYPNRINLPWNIYWIRTDFSGPVGTSGGRVNIAIMTPFRADSTLVARPVFYGNNGLPTSRPALGIRLGQTLFYSVHALSSGGNDGVSLVNNISAQANGRTWAAMGDWNREPANLQLQRGWHKYTSGGATHMGGNGTNRELDYMVSNSRIAGYGGIARGFGSDHLAVGFRRLAANASVQLLNAHDDNRALEVEAQGTGSYIVATSKTPGPWGHFRFVNAGNGNYTIRVMKRNANEPEQCLDATDAQLTRFDCVSGDNAQLFDMRYWNDTGQLQIKPLNRSTCLGDDTDFGWGSEIVTTMSCSKGESRFNFRFDKDPGAGANPVVF
ncbi:hypothetical protein HLK59_02055 [Streptomyces sp. S3(2020)]|uniref:hypothetical protein n=1 Tax=Streptomyces sp. S3(2020) TaxID=2732044 RepID=UPI0014890D0B|nr:hypothetical protein [Streptomyces sp. S3(2020)]NNN29155.1 hypothetical protein [Streptomyces sp. S3(2020)]